jgi:hypothetical protein
MRKGLAPPPAAVHTSRMRRGLPLPCLLALALVGCLVPRSSAAQAIAQTRHWYGQGVAPIPKGFVPKYEVRSVAFRNRPNDELEIPPNSVVRHDGYMRLTRPARIDAFQPHMHMRGKAMTLEAILPDNTVEILSSVDHFDFNWHVSYLYAEDVAPLLPANTMLHMIGVHDNTAANKRNPDPNMWVGFGERSVDDMLQVWINTNLQT